MCGIAGFLDCSGAGDSPVAMKRTIRRMTDFIEVRLVKTDGERTDRPRAGCLHQGHDDRRIDPSREECSQRNEAGQAKSVTRHIGAEHTELYITPNEAMAAIPRLPAIYDEPFADSSQIPTLLVAELARRHVTVSLSGDGGGRTLASISPRHLEALSRCLAVITPSRFGLHNPALKLHRLAEVIASADPDSLYLGLVSQWKDPASVVLGEREPLTPRRLRDQALLDPAPIREKWREHLSGCRNWQSNLWSVLMFQAWLKEQNKEIPALTSRAAPV
jgi:Asparagine synthase